MPDLTRAIRRLADLPNDRFLAEVSEGMAHIAANVARYISDHEALSAAGRSRGAEVLLALAQEEAAKYLILLDAVRCPKVGGRRAVHLRTFYDHFSKAKYVEALVWT